MAEGLESKVKKPGFFKKAALIAGASILSILSMGCSQIQYRARVQTVPAEEVNIYIDGKLKGKTSKKEPVYVESDKYLLTEFTPQRKSCKISLKANNYNAHFDMRHIEDLEELLKSGEKIKILDRENRSKNCLMAGVTKWENGLSYNLMFRIPLDKIKDLHKPVKRYTEWGDEIKEPRVIPEKKEPYKKPSEPIKPVPYTKPEPKKPYKTPAEPIKPVPKKPIPYTKPEPKKPYAKPSEPKESSLPTSTKNIPEISPLPKKKPKISTDIGQLVDKKISAEFCASIGVGSAYGGIDALGISAGIEFYLEKKTEKNLDIAVSLELFASAGYLLLTKDTWLNKYGAEVGMTMHAKYYKDWSFYLKLFGGTQGKDVEWTSPTKVEEVTLYGLGLFAGHRFVIKDNFFISIDAGWICLIGVEEWQRDAFGFDIGVGVKF